MGDLEKKFEALLRGAGTSATAGWGDEGIAAILGALPMPEDPAGVERNYAAGSPEQDYRNTERFANSEAERKFPGTFRSGQLLGAAPAMMAGTGAGGIAGAGLMGGLRGAISGAGHADEGDRIQGGARLAGPSAIASMLGAAAPAVLGKAKDLFKGSGGPPMGGLQPAFAGAGATGGARAAEEGMPFINMMSTAPAKRGPKMGGRATPSEDERIIAQDRARWEEENPLEAQRAPNVGRPAVPPRAPNDPEAAYTPTIPPAGKTGVPSLKQGFKDLVQQDAELAEEAARQPTRIKMRENLIDKTPPVNHADPAQSRMALENDPTWRKMNEMIYGREFKPMGRNSPGWRGVDPMRAPPVDKADRNFTVPKTPKLPDFAKETAAAEEHAALQEGIDAIKKRTQAKLAASGGKTTPAGPPEDDENQIRTLLGTLPL